METGDAGSSTWNQMRTVCQEEGGDLASLTSNALGEKLFLKAKDSLVKINGYTWIWMWIAGSGNGTVDGTCMVFNKNGTQLQFDNCTGRLESLIKWEYPFAICERCIEKIRCKSQCDCDGNATCNHNQLNYRKFGEANDIVNKTCNCNFGFYGNGTVCIKVD